jgi:hypothetical protein
VRDRRQPERYIPPDFHSNFTLSITDDDPGTVREAVNSEDSKLWKKAMVEEMDALDKNEALDIVEFCWQPIQFFQLPLKLPTPMSLELQISVAFCKQKTFLFHATLANWFRFSFHD